MLELLILWALAATICALHFYWSMGTDLDYWKKQADDYQSNYDRVVKERNNLRTELASHVHCSAENYDRVINQRDEAERRADCMETFINKVVDAYHSYKYGGLNPEEAGKPRPLKELGEMTAEVHYDPELPFTDDLCGTPFKVVID